MSNVVYLTKADPANATPSPMTSKTEQKLAPRLIGRMRAALGRLLACADLLGRQQREIAALRARVERLEGLCERALQGDDSA